MNLMQMVFNCKMYNDSTSPYFDFILFSDTLPGLAGMGNTMNAVFVL